MLNRYYQEEVAYLRELGREFAAAHPDAAPMLSSTSSDPDVERLLEGFAFLTGRLRQKLDDELPELTHALLDSFWPDVLCPIPAMCIVQFESSRQGERESRIVPRGTPIDSVPVDGTRCRFLTAWDAQVLPWKLSDLTVRAGSTPVISFRIQLAEPLVKIPPYLRLHLTGPGAVVGGLLSAFLRHCTGVTAIAGNKRISLPRPQAVGFGKDDRLLDVDGSSDPGLSCLRDWSALPQAFHFVDLPGLDRLVGAPGQSQGGLGPVLDLTIECQLERLPNGLPAVHIGNLALGCTPAINRFPGEADPVVLTLERRDHRLRPAGDRPDHREIHSITHVIGQVRGESRPRTYRPLFSAAPGAAAAAGGYLTRRRPAVVGSGTDCFLRLSRSASDSPDPKQIETLTISVRLTNRHLPQALAAGDLRESTPQTPPGVRFRNLAPPTSAISMAPDGSTLRRLIAQLAGRYRTLADPVALREILELAHVRIRADQQARQSVARLGEAITAARTTAATLVRDGVPLRGVDLLIELKEDHFENEGDLHLFARLLDEFLAHGAALNSFTRLGIDGSGGDRFRLAPRLGRHRLV